MTSKSNVKVIHSPEVKIKLKIEELNSEEVSDFKTLLIIFTYLLSIEKELIHHKTKNETSRKIEKGKKRNAPLEKGLRNAKRILE
jgi:hypothetical protein